MIYDELKNILDTSGLPVVYQTHTWDGKAINVGIRGNSRRDKILKEDIIGKNVLDLGCATGAECIWAMEIGAKSVIGLEITKEKIETFNKMISCLNSHGYSNIEGYEYDLNNPVIIKSPIDTIFCFAITQYIKYRKIWHDIPSARVVYVEGGGDSPYTEETLSDNIYKATLIGRTTANSADQRLLRPLFRLERI